jgi:hypothetical protein
MTPDDDTGIRYPNPAAALDAILGDDEYRWAIRREVSDGVATGWWQAFVSSSPRATSGGGGPMQAIPKTRVFAPDEETQRLIADHITRNAYRFFQGPRPRQFAADREASQEATR